MTIPDDVRAFCEKTRTHLPINELELIDIINRMKAVGLR